jgi:hypothetical protein
VTMTELDKLSLEEVDQLYDVALAFDEAESRATKKARRK